MVATWIESGAKGRHGGPVRAGMWAALVVGTHPVETDQEVWLELSADDVSLGRLPCFWLENKGVNSFWHARIRRKGSARACVIAPRRGRTARSPRTALGKR